MTLPPMSGLGFDRAAHRRTDETWLAEAWGRARVLQITPKSVALLDGEGLSFGSSTDVPHGAIRRFLGEVDGVPYFAATVESDTDPAQWASLRDIGAVLSDTTGGMFAAAIGLEQWHQRHRRCPLCGTPTVESQAGWTRTCPADSSTHFPRTDPAVIMVITTGSGDDARCLLGRGVNWPEGRFSTLAGFVEPGESLEAAVAREVAEETAIEITDIRYLASQPWPFPSSLMLGFSARLKGDPTIRCDQKEMAEAGWFTRAEVAAAADRTDRNVAPDPAARLQFVSPKLSISRWLLDEWLAGRTG